MSRHIELSGTLQIAAPPATAFQFFTPEGERLWVAGWEPEYLHPSDGSLVEGLTFRTRHGGEETVWLVLRRDGVAAVDYMRVTPGSRIGSVSVRLAPAGDGSNVTVSYTLTALSAEGEMALDGFAARFPAYLAEWQQSINGLIADASRP